MIKLKVERPFFYDKNIPNRAMTSQENNIFCVNVICLANCDHYIIFVFGSTNKQTLPIRLQNYKLQHFSLVQKYPFLSGYVFLLLETATSK